VWGGLGGGVGVCERKGEREWRCEWVWVCVGVCGCVWVCVGVCGLHAWLVEDVGGVRIVSAGGEVGRFCRLS